MTSKLTLNLGLRYEYFGQLNENYGAQPNFLLNRAKRAFDVPANAETLQYSILRGLQRRLRRPIALISAVPASRVSGYRRREISRRDSDLPIKLTPKLVARGGYGIFYGGFENSVIETYVDFPFQFSLGYGYQVPDAPITFSNGSIGTLETGFTGIPLTSANS